MVADSNWSLLVTGVKRLSEDPGRLIDNLRSAHPKVTVQAADALVVYGQDHAMGALFIAIEAFERKVMIANRPEAEVLLRLACTNQISEALTRTGLKSGHPGCFLAFSKDLQPLKKFGEHLSERFDLDDSVLLPTRIKKAQLVKMLGVSPPKIHDREFLQFLLERAAVLVRG